MSPEHVERYLRLLGVPRREPGLEALRELVRAQLARIPFENVSKLHRLRHDGLRGLPDLETHLDGVERFHFGGTCYANNHHLHELLVALGYEARLCGADMAHPDVHVVVMVRLGGRDHLVDAGYGAPFLEPMPLDLASDTEIVLGPDRYLLRPRDGRGASRVEIWRDGTLRHAYVAWPRPRRMEEFEPVVVDSFRPEATFMNALMLARFWPGRAVVIRNRTVLECEGGRSRTRTMADRDELGRAVEAHFGIPRPITDGVVRGLGALDSDWE